MPQQCDDAWAWVKMEKFLSKQRRLVELEREWEWQENSTILTSVSHVKLQRLGKALLNLTIVSYFTGVGGKMHLEFANSLAPALPSTKIRTGDVVKMEEHGSSDEIGQGIVTKLHGNSLVVCLQQASVDVDKFVGSNQKFKLFQMPNEISFKRYMQVLDTLESTIAKQICSSAFFTKLDEIPATEISLSFYNDQLDRSQRAAVQHALTVKPLALIHGPPGTGKTMTLIEIILQLVKPTNSMLYGDGQQGNRVLVCGPSNISVDNLVERLDSYASKLGITMIRTGQPARILESTIKYSLDSQLHRCGHGEIIDGLRREINQQVDKLFVKKERVKNRREELDLLKALRKDLKERELKVTKELIFSHSHSTVVFSTLTGVGSKVFQGKNETFEYDYVVIDESTQALEVECWIAMVKAKKAVILAGDHHQLPPTVTCPEAIKEGLERTCFSRIDRLNPHLIKMLSIQYRMNEKIMAFSSREFYHGKLECAAQVQFITLQDFVSSSDDTGMLEPLVWIDTQHLAGARESDEVEVGVVQDSKKNVIEARIAVQRVKFLIQTVQLSTSDIAIVSPYNAQVALIKDLLATEGIDVEVGTVDGFQGREKEVIVFSAVRSNDRREIGFLSDYRRLNVAITRAKRQLIVIGDCQTLNVDLLFKKLIDYFEAEGLFEYPDEDEFLGV